jgi:ketosteroid isomerase-like protein
MKLNQIKEVMKRYGKAWEKQDVSLILDCFTQDGIYQESPLSKPYKGHEEIKEFWEKTVLKDTKKIRFSFSNCYTSRDEKTGFAEWKCTNVYKGKKNKMVGIMILKMKGNKISYLNEYWNTEVGR